MTSKAADSSKSMLPPVSRPLVLSRLRGQGHDGQSPLERKMLLSSLIIPSGLLDSAGLRCGTHGPIIIQVHGGTV